jgi:hypothetical protein
MGKYSKQTPIYSVELVTQNGVDGLFIKNFDFSANAAQFYSTSCNDCGKFIPLTGGGGSGTDSQTLTFSSPNLSISNGNSVDLTSLVNISETLTTLDSASIDSSNILTIKYTGESGTQQSVTANLSTLKTNIAIADLLTTGNKIAKITVNGTDFEIKETITSIAQPTWNSTTGAFVLKYTDETGTENIFTTTILPTFINTDEQELTGDTTGNVELTLTPVTVSGVTNYTIKADVKLATTTPNGKTNALKENSSNQLFVEPETLTTLDSLAINGTNLEVKYTGENGTQVTKSVGISSLINVPETVTSFTGLLTTGTKIGTYQKEDGTTQDIFAPSGGSAADGSETKVNAGTNVTVTGSGTSASPYVINSASFVQSNTRFVATANQTSFTLSFTPLGVVQFFRNGAQIDSTAYSVSGTTLTYTPANNGGATLGALVAGDIINVYGISK